MKGTDIECTIIECILPWVMKNWAGCKKFGVVGYTSSDIDLVCTTTGQRSKLGFYVPFNSQGHIGTGPQNCHLWDSNPQR